MKRSSDEELQMSGPNRPESHVKRSRRSLKDHGLDAARKIEQSISYMSQHLNQPLEVAALAAAVSVSPSHYSALFKRWTGCSPIDYFIHLRMQRACELFDSTSSNVKEVAAALGYDDAFYFSRAFKKINRVSPTEYRVMPEKGRAAVKNAAALAAFSNHRMAQPGTDAPGG